MSGKTPKVCVLLATYNPNLEFFKQQLESVKSQDYPNLEVIIVDDGSTVDKFEALSALTVNCRNIKLLQFENVGVVANFERGLAEFLKTSADLIALSDQDDIWDRDKITKLVAYYLSEPCDLVHCDMRVISEENVVLNESVFRLENRRRVIDDPWQLILRNSITGCASLFSRELAQKSIPFPQVSKTDPEIYHDHWIATWAYLGRGIRFLDQPLQSYRQHGGNLVGAGKRNKKQLERIGEKAAKVALGRDILAKLVAAQGGALQLPNFARLQPQELKLYIIWKLGNLILKIARKSDSQF